MICIVEIISDEVLLIIVYRENPFVEIFKRLLAARINSKNTHLTKNTQFICIPAILAGLGGHSRNLTSEPELCC